MYDVTIYIVLISKVLNFSNFANLKCLLIFSMNLLTIIGMVHVAILNSCGYFFKKQLFPKNYTRKIIISKVNVEWIKHLLCTYYITCALKEKKRYMYMYIYGIHVHVYIWCTCTCIHTYTYTHREANCRRLVRRWEISFLAVPRETGKLFSPLTPLTLDTMLQVMYTI